MEDGNSIMESYDHDLFLRKVSNLAAIDDVTSKCFLGGTKNQKGYDSGEIEVIDTKIAGTPEDFVVWIATDGSWQNFKKDKDNRKRQMNPSFKDFK